VKKVMTITERLAVDIRRRRRERILALELTPAQREAWVERALANPVCGRPYTPQDVSPEYLVGEEHKLKRKIRVENRWSWIELMATSLVFEPPYRLLAKWTPMPVRPEPERLSEEV
jgi:hypothetical protein